MLTQKNVWRVIALLAAAVLIQASTGVTLLEASRTSAACTHACNEIRKLCQAQCTTDCLALFGSGTPEFTACNASCRIACGVDSDECKAKCNVVTPPPTNGEP